MSAHSFSRRELFRLVTGLTLCKALKAYGAEAPPPDQGIGGTGAAPSTAEEGDRGIGGTGVVGTIRKFGSIYVNGLKIAYPESVRVQIDGEPADVADLQVGQVVRVVAREANGAYSTQSIDVTSEVAGPIEAVSEKSLKVLGQTIVLSGLSDGATWRRGDFVAVYGLRRPDGSIVASLVSRRRPGVLRVAGRVRKFSDGSLGIGALRLNGLDASLVGARAIVSGVVRKGRFVVGAQTTESTLLHLPDVHQFLVEAYVEKGRRGLTLGSGLPVSGGRIAGSGTAGAPSIVRLNAGDGGRLTVESVRPARFESGTGHSERGSHRGSGRRIGGPAGSGKAPGGQRTPRRGGLRDLFRSGERDLNAPGERGSMPSEQAPFGLRGGGSDAGGGFGGSAPPGANFGDGSGDGGRGFGGLGGGARGPGRR